MFVRSFTEADFPSVRAIYQQGIDTGQATFETKTKDWQEWDSAYRTSPRLVAEVDGEILGWGALAPVSGRCVYGGVAEVSLYIASTARGKGVGSTLLEALVAASEKEEIWTLQAGIFYENKVSIAVHRKCGFRIVGMREKLGKLGDSWRDIVLLERRSRVVGI